MSENELSEAVVAPEVFFKKHAVGPDKSSSGEQEEEPLKPPIEFLSPDELAGWDMPEGYLLVGDMDIVRESWFVIGGTQGVGKSRLVSNLGVSGATGDPWMGLPVHTKFKTLVIQCENGRARLRNEMDALRVEVRRKHDVNISDYLRVSPPPDYGLDFSDPKFREVVREYILDFGPSVVVIDPWNKVAMDDKGKDYREAFDLINQTCWVGGLKPAIGVVAHLRKPTSNDKPGRDGMHRFSGHHILTSAPRSAYILDAASSDVTDDRVVFSACKNNDGMMAKPSAWKRGSASFLPLDDFDWDEFNSKWEGQESKAGRKRKHSDEDYVALLPAEGLTYSEFIKATKDELSVGHATTDRALKRLLSGDDPLIFKSVACGRYQPIMRGDNA